LDITRSRIGLSGDDLNKWVEIAPSGVVRLAKLQSRGYACIKTE